MFKTDPAMLRTILGQLEQATHEYAAWHENLVRTIVCRLPANPDDLLEDAHHGCRFGQWYYGQVPADLRGEPAFGSMEAEHRRLHGIAARLLRQAASGGPIACQDYDGLVAVSAKLRLALDSLTHEVEGALRSRDVLTGAYGRADMLPELREWRELARRGIQQCCIVFMDLDHLKEVNDRHGHSVGDQVLATAVQFVIRHLRAYDKVFRYGGDEFLISLPGADLAVSELLIERIRAGLGATPLAVGADGHPLHVTASFGLAPLAPEVCIEESVERADRALLLAKAGGRDRAVSWHPSITP